MAEHKYSYSYKQTAMSHVDSKDDEVKSILAQIDSDDSKESDKPKKSVKKSYENKEGQTQYEINTEDTPDTEW